MELILTMKTRCATEVGVNVKSDNTDSTCEKLHNGITLPQQWPPTDINPQSEEPMEVPYLKHPPDIIPIDIGRQLFVDDFLIESTSLSRVFHQAEKYEKNPVLKPETPFEMKSGSVETFNNAVLYDPCDRLFKMYYTTGELGCAAFQPALAHSELSHFLGGTLQ